MNHEYYLTFVILRKAGRIGRLWPVNNGYLLAPLEAVVGVNDYSLAEFISSEKLLNLLDELSGLRIEKKSAGREFMKEERKVG